MHRIVIIGGVAGGASCAARLRRLDEQASIVVLERGEFVSYANCGLPYYVGGAIRSREALLLQTPEALRAKFAIDVRTRNEVVLIDRQAKTVRVRVIDGRTYDEPYDTLVIATGSSPVRPPIPGIDSPRIRTVWTVDDAVGLKELAHKERMRTPTGSAVVVGGGFIGLEAAENLVAAGLDVSLVEATDQVMPPLDPEMAQIVHGKLAAEGIHLHLGDGVSSFETTGDDVTTHLASGTSVTAGLVVLAIGVRPNGELARAAGLAVNERGGIKVDDLLRTSDPDIYAVGDVIEVTDLVSEEPTMVPLAGPANRQGRMAADNICGADKHYRGTQGTSIAKAFDLAIATTGASEKTLVRRRLQRGRDFESVTIVQNSHATYYPGATPLTIKLLFSLDGGRILGAQIVGKDGVDKRIDVIATTLRLGGSVHDLAELELSYAPPFSSAKDPVNMAGFVAENLLDGLVAFARWDEPGTSPDALLLDVREASEVARYAIPGALDIPLGQLRGRLDELARWKDGKVIVFCAIGVRAYNAARILVQHGFSDVRVYPGGSSFFAATHPDLTDRKDSQHETRG